MTSDFLKASTPDQACEVGIKCLHWALEHIHWCWSCAPEFLVLNLIRMRDEEESFSIPRPKCGRLSYSNIIVWPYLGRA